MPKNNHEQMRAFFKTWKVFCLLLTLLATSGIALVECGSQAACAQHAQELDGFEQTHDSVDYPRLSQGPEILHEDDQYSEHQVEYDATYHTDIRTPDPTPQDELAKHLQQLVQTDLTSKENLQSTIKYIGLITVLSLAPALFLMTTSYVRIIVVLSILRQAIGLGQTPSTQVLTALSMFLTVLIMTPVWTESYQTAIAPYTNQDSDMEWSEAIEHGLRPIKRFMSRQIDIAENIDDIWMFYQYLPAEEKLIEPKTFDDIPLRVMLPAFLISELKVAFLIGFSIFLPFLVLDLIVSSISVSMGMVMLPPAMISLPLKLALFVLVDGWTLVIGMLLQSFSAYG
ncbi:MAG TPA: flagellar type III secretion system pore protein FliP [Pirellulaceae bacterium]|nr:flagellar type III secretion system pore protein FliP [Pirellulaceae bacterium]HMO92635.1 flagellar type III secretion system pore protein FliP [Pirellulaceae bacterium]HMP70217.1 flagellar type III secretion system pore protein FliP [Pirellulaceae bacterium]